MPDLSSCLSWITPPADNFREPGNVIGTDNRGNPLAVDASGNLSVSGHPEIPVENPIRVDENVLMVDIPNRNGDLFPSSLISNLSTITISDNIPFWAPSSVRLSISNQYNCPEHGPVVETISFNFPPDINEVYCTRCMRDVLRKFITPLNNTGTKSPEPIPEQPINLKSRYDLIKQKDSTP